MRLDVIVSGGLVFDGTGAPPVPADLGIRAGRLAEMGDLSKAEASEVIDAGGLAVAPGFIDTHTHSDLACFLPTEHNDVIAASVRQGVTTEVCGNCGFSPFPAFGSDPDRVAGAILGPRRFPDLEAYASAVREAGLLANLAPLLGHGTLRAAVMGFENRPPRPDELRKMVRLADRSLEQGAVGISTGLIYAPGLYADTGEIVAICRAAASRGRPYTTHMRGESDMVADSVREAIRIGAESGVPVHISHHKVAGRANWGRTEETLGLVDRARRQGMDLTLDVYPYTAGSTMLHAMLPAWAQEGGVPKMMERLRDGQARDRIKADLVADIPGWENLQRAAGWEGIVIATAPERPEIEGRSIADLAADGGRDAADVALDLIVEQGAMATMIIHVMAEADVRRVLAYEGAMIGSDGIPTPGKPHPRWAGTFTRVLGHYAREQGLFDLATAIRKMTSQAAQRFGLSDRGLIERGLIADLVVFDPGTVLDRSTYEEPLLRPAGISHVLVAGIPVVRDGELTGAKPGAVLTA